MNDSVSHLAATHCTFHELKAKRRASAIQEERVPPKNVSFQTSPELWSANAWYGNKMYPEHWDEYPHHRWTKYTKSSLQNMYDSSGNLMRKFEVRKSSKAILFPQLVWSFVYEPLVTKKVESSECFCHFYYHEINILKKKICDIKLFFPVIYLWHQIIYITIKNW